MIRVTDATKVANQIKFHGLKLVNIPETIKPKRVKCDIRMQYAPYFCKTRIRRWYPMPRDVGTIVPVCQFCNIKTYCDQKGVKCYGIWETRSRIKFLNFGKD